MLLIDIDYFKKVNDQYGHEAGDKVLVHLAQMLKSSVRATDYVIRWGGDYHAAIKKADEAMYQAKAAGRNKVVLYEG